MSKKYYIVPTTKSYYEDVTVGEEENEIDALEKFTDKMDLDMSAYFKAVETRPDVPYLYENPTNMFEQELSNIIKDADTYGKCFDLSLVAKLQDLYNNTNKQITVDEEFVESYIGTLKTCTRDVTFEIPALAYESDEPRQLIKKLFYHHGLIMQNEENPKETKVNVAAPYALTMYNAIKSTGLGFIVN